MNRLIEIIKKTTKENLHIATFMIKDCLNKDEITYPEFMEMECLIKMMASS